MTYTFPEIERAMSVILGYWRNGQDVPYLTKRLCDDFINDLKRLHYFDCYDTEILRALNNACLKNARGL